MTRIDSHHHFWTYTPADYPWIDDTKSVIRRDFLPPDLSIKLASAGVSGAISVQARQSLAETWQLLEFADRHEIIKAVVGWVPLISPDVNRVLPTVAQHPKLKAVRHVLQDEADPLYMLRDDFNRGIASLKPFGLAYDILIFERHLPQTIEFVDRHPDQVFILDHLGKPRVKDRLLSPWTEHIKELAKRPNIYCKISGLATEAEYANWTEQQLRPYLDAVLSAFTPQRVMFGSDWPVCLLATGYKQWADIVERSMAGLSESEQQRIWSGTAQEAYKLG